VACSPPTATLTDKSNTFFSSLRSSPRSSQATLNGINELASGVGRGGEKEQELRQEIEEWHETAERLGGQVEAGEGKIAELERYIEALKGKVNQGDDYIRSLEDQVAQLQGDMREILSRENKQRDGFQEMMKREQETLSVALGEIEKLGRSEGANDGLVREMQEVMKSPVGSVGKGRGSANFSDQQGVNIKPFSGGATAAGGDSSKMKEGQKRTPPPLNIKGVNDPDLPSKKIINRLHRYMVENKIDMEQEWKRMDVNKDGFLSFDELFEALKGLGLGVSFGDVLVLHKFLAGEMGRGAKRRVMISCIGAKNTRHS